MQDARGREWREGWEVKGKTRRDEKDGMRGREGGMLKVCN